MRLTIEDALDIFNYAAEGRTNSVKPDLLANEINRRIDRILEAERDAAKARVAAVVREAVAHIRQFKDGYATFEATANYLLSLIPQLGGTVSGAYKYRPKYTQNEIGPSGGTGERTLRLHCPKCARITVTFTLAEQKEIAAKLHSSVDSHRVECPICHSHQWELASRKVE